MILNWKKDMNRINSRVIARGSVFCSLAIAISALSITTPKANAATASNIAIDGSFGDWSSVPSYYDAHAPTDIFHFGTTIPDVHDTDHDTLNSIPTAVNHPDVDILEYKFTHDSENLYAYFRASGEIGRTQEASAGKAGRYYVIVTIDVDNDVDTGYWLHEGGYFPTSDGYDMNMEVEFYDGEVNTAHYLSHDALSPTELTQDFKDLTQGQYPSNGSTGTYPVGFVQPASGNYDEYTQWVYQDDTALTLVLDKGPVVPGIMTVELSPDGHEIEFAAPFKGFLNNASGNPNMDLGKILNVSFSLEASGELATGDWASDTADTIFGYTLEDSFDIADLNNDFSVDGLDFGILAGNWASTSATPEEGNINGDGFVDGADIGIMFENWTADTGPDFEALTVFYDADLNGDSDVDIDDYNILEGHWAETTATAGEGNINEDGHVDAADIGIMFEQWNGGDPSAAVPEPTSLALAALAMCGLMASRSRCTRS